MPALVEVDPEGPRDPLIRFSDVGRDHFRDSPSSFTSRWRTGAVRSDPLGWRLQAACCSSGGPLERRSEGWRVLSARWVAGVPITMA